MMNGTDLNQGSLVLEATALSAVQVTFYFQLILRFDKSLILQILMPQNFKLSFKSMQILLI